MTTLTQCQQQVLDMLISYQKERGFPPTNQEVATMLGYRSVNAAVEHLRALEKKGVITIKRGVARGITLHTAVKDDDSEAVGITAINNIKKFWSLTAKGCMFGKNITSPANPRETQPHFFESRFPELLKLLDTVH